MDMGVVVVWRVVVVVVRVGVVEICLLIGLCGVG